MRAVAPSGAPGVDATDRHHDPSLPCRQIDSRGHRHRPAHVRRRSCRRSCPFAFRQIGIERKLTVDVSRPALQNIVCTMSLPSSRMPSRSVSSSNLACRVSPEDARLSASGPCVDEPEPAASCQRESLGIDGHRRTIADLPPEQRATLQSYQTVTTILPRCLLASMCSNALPISSKANTLSIGNCSFREFHRAARYPCGLRQKSRGFPRSSGCGR